MIIGLPGGSGCRKTTLLDLIAQQGGLVLDCDAIYHELLRTDPALTAAIERRFPGYLRAAKARLMRVYIHVYMQIPGKDEYAVHLKRVYEGIRKLCPSVVRDPEAKRGTRLAAFIACVHPVLLRWLNRFKRFAK